ncbi:MAG: hypothetical protein ACE5JM_06215, partial [Armatimonadota bacterium]
MADVWAADDTGALRGAVGAPPGWRTAGDYSRQLFQPLQRYSCDAVQAMVEEIRAEGHPVPTGH